MHITPFITVYLCKLKNLFTTTTWHTYYEIPLFKCMFVTLPAQPNKSDDMFNLFHLGITTIT